ncbi:MAG: class II fructose-bisphosphate aldolase [Planctomycetota bacterium]|nr:class II fructose-bisphosphate aldolase [Planctomycetota bacterium]
MKEMLEKAYRGRYAVGGFDAFDAISVMALLEESKARKSPALMICAPLEYAALGARGVVAVARALSDLVGVDACLHLDHSPSFEDVVEAAEAGFTSVMIDGSSLDFEQNIALTKKTVDFAHPRGIPVEAELGAVGRVDNSTAEGAEHAGNVFTDPAKAAEFVERSGCDFLAVSIGNAHGLYRDLPNFDFSILEAIHKNVSIPLVLHGGSGTPEDQLKKSLTMGIAKVNVASEIGRAFTSVYVPETVEKKTWWATAKSLAKIEMRKVIGSWMHTLGSEGKR